MMEAILSNEDYTEFTNRVNIARERGVDVPHDVEQIGDKFKITLLEKVDLNLLDEITS